jgi:hypothetical protein
MFLVNLIFPYEQITKFISASPSGGRIIQPPRSIAPEVFVDNALGDYQVRHGLITSGMLTIGSSTVTFREQHARQQPE